MSLRGEVTIECDVPGCYAEDVFTADQVLAGDVVTLALFKGWRVTGWRPDYRFTCPQCVAEGKD